MKTNTIITISRQFGSGGRAIGKKLSEVLNIPFYDKELIDLAAKDSGMDVEVFERESTRTSRAFYVLGAINYTLGTPISITPEMSLNDRLFSIQSQMIENIANEGPCVIVGRCADAVLKDRDNVLNVFIHGDINDRIKRTVEEYGMDEDDVIDLEDFVTKIDKQRANYYHYYTNQKWGKVENYHLTMDSSKFTQDEIVDAILHVIKAK